MVTQMHKQARNIWPWSVCFFLSCWLANPTLADDSLRFVESLRTRGLDRLAELRCREQLSDSSLPPRLVASYAIQQSLIEIDRATSQRTDRDTHWRNAQETLDKIARERGPSDAWLLLRLQAGLNGSTRGEFEQAIADERAVASLRSASKQLASVEQAIESMRRAGSKIFSTRELDSLANRTALARAQSERLLALCHPAGSPDRDDALLQAAQAASNIAARIESDELRWRGRLLLVECERLLRKAPAALARLDSEPWQTPPVPERLAGAFAAERWRLLIASQRHDEANRLLVTQSSPTRSPELQLARLEAMAARWTTNQEEQLANRIQQSLVAIRQNHGGLWAARAERIAGDALAIPADGSSVDTLVTTAEYLFRTGRLQEAVDAYDRAAGLAFREEANGRAYELARTAAAIVRSQGQSFAAAERFRRAALSESRRADASATHRLAILTASEVLQTASPHPTRDHRAEELYQELLGEHLRTWPEAESVAEVRWWQATWLARKGQQQELVSLLSTIKQADPRYAQAIRLLGEAYLTAAQEAANDPRSHQALLVEATSSLQAVITGNDNRWPARWTPLQRQTALTLAKLHGGDYAQKLLSKAIDSSPPPQDKTWLDEAQAVLLVLLVDAGKAGEASQRVAANPLRTPSTVRRLLVALQQRLQAASDASVAELMLALLRTAAGNDQDGRWKAPFAAAALAASGRTDEAVAVYENLLAQQPRDARLRLELATLLATTTNPEQLQRAVDSFATVEQGVTKGGSLWWDARIGRLRALMASGHHEQASKLLRLTKVLHADLGQRGEEFAAIENSLANGPQPLTP